jgi:hypothetical protein
MIKTDLIQHAILFTNEKGFIPEIDELADFLSLELNEIKSFYTSTDDLVTDYFREAIQTIHDQNIDIEAYAELSFGEGFAHWLYSLADLLKQEPVFSRIGWRIIESGIFYGSKIEIEFKELFSSLVVQDNRISSTAQLLVGDLFYGQMIRDFEQFMHTILNDSLNEDQWTERIDKYTSLVDAFLHNDLPDKGFSYLKTLYSQGEFSLKKWFF